MFSIVLHWRVDHNPFSFPVGGKENTIMEEGNRYYAQPYQCAGNRSPPEISVRKFAMRQKFHAHEMRFPSALTACIVKKPMLFGPEGIFFVVVVLDRF